MPFSRKIHKVIFRHGINLSVRKRLDIILKLARFSPALDQPDMHLESVTAHEVMNAYCVLVF